MELPGAVQPSKASLSGRCPGLSVPEAGGEWGGGAPYSAPPSNSQDDAEAASSPCSGLSFLKCLRWIQVCEDFPGVIL